MRVCFHRLQAVTTTMSPSLASKVLSQFRYMTLAISKEKILSGFSSTFLSPYVQPASKTVYLSRTFFKSRKTYMYEGTIFSLSSGYGKCGVAVIRVSGPQSSEVLRKIGNFKQLPVPRQAVLRRLVNPESGEMIDRGIVLFFPKPKSFTCEDCVEFHVHGGTAVISALLAAISRVPGCRHAEPGEFTKRAFLNGRLDLTEVEGLGDLIHAETEAQRRQALRQMEGELGTLYTQWTNILKKSLADVEAFIDFSEDQDIEEQVVTEVNERISGLAREIRAHLDDNRQGERLRQGVQVVIIGEPNVGKSSLLNAVCQRSAAIVTPVAGTTRDVIETAVHIGGYPVVLSDTAGLRRSEDVVEKEGIQRALERCHNADLKILMLDSSDMNDSLGTSSDFKHSLVSYIESLTSLYVTKTEIDTEADHLNSDTNKKCALRDSLMNESVKVPNDETPESLTNSANSADLENMIIVFNKIDKLDTEELEILNGRIHGMEKNKLQICLLSCLSGSGFSEFLEVLKMKVEILCGDPLVGHPSLTQERHRDLLNRCLLNLHKYTDQIEGDDIVLAAQCLRRSLKYLGNITGKVTSEDILEVIFRDFCIGK